MRSSLQSKAFRVSLLSHRCARLAFPDTSWACHVRGQRGNSSSASDRPSVLYHGHGASPVQVDLARSSRKFRARHNGIPDGSFKSMVSTLDPPAESLDAFIEEALPKDILRTQFPPIAQSASEHGFLHGHFKYLEKLNDTSFMDCIGCGYHATLTPEVIRQNVLLNPAWFTSYTPYQPEISQGRLESLLNFQTMVADLTSLPVSNASLLDEPTAAAEAMTLSINALTTAKSKRPRKIFVVSHLCHPQTVAVLRTRAEGQGITITITDILKDDCSVLEKMGDDLIGVLAQYPDTEGGVYDFHNLGERIHAKGGIFCVATDLLALTLLKPPGEFGADIAFGSAQRFGVPLGFGGPHAAFFACTDKLKRKIPGRLVGVSKDRHGIKALRLALQTREQHIRREKATSNICTAQALLANVSAFYAIYHGPDGLRQIATRVATYVRYLEETIRTFGYDTGFRGKGRQARAIFDTLTVHIPGGKALQFAEFAASSQNKVNVRLFDSDRIGITLGEDVRVSSVNHLVKVFELFARDSGMLGKDKKNPEPLREWSFDAQEVIPEPLRRSSQFLTHPVFNSYHSETELLRYIYHLQSKDLSLVHSMIPLGSCTMKLNAATEIATLGSAAFSSLHPFAPAAQTKGYKKLFRALEKRLATITGLHAVSLQPNSGAQGEFAGLRVIRKFQETRPGKKRDICLIPISAHGTNPASAVMAGMRVVSLKCEPKTGNLDMDDLRQKCEKHGDELSAIMVTYPSTFGVFEPNIKQVCEIVHSHGGQVYMDGANMNAQIGLCSPGDIGADVCHLNLHKTFCIPHGGGGPGVGPIAVREHLQPFLPSHPLVQVEGATEFSIGPISGAPYGSASILPISYAYIQMMGTNGLTQATKLALLNANYMMSRLKPHFPILYTNSNGRCAHEFIVDIRPFIETAGIQAIDVAKRLQDYGFHAPTMSWPVANTLMIEPTESENKPEMDRYCDALAEIRKEIQEIEDGKQPREGNLLKMAPHSQRDLLEGDVWDRSYTRARAAYPLPWLKEKKFWPSVTRVDDGESPFPDLPSPP